MVDPGILKGRSRETMPALGILGTAFRLEHHTFAPAADRGFSENNDPAPEAKATNPGFIVKALFDVRDHESCGSWLYAFHVQTAALPGEGAKLVRLAWSKA
jgi:hypothetical protein